MGNNVLSCFPYLIRGRAIQVSGLPSPGYHTSINHNKFQISGQISKFKGPLPPPYLISSIFISFVLEGIQESLTANLKLVSQLLMKFKIEDMSQFSFPFWLWIKRIYVWFTIKRKTASTIILISIWKNYKSIPLTMFEYRSI